MAISFERALGIHEQALQVRGQRAEVLANNLANADTPNYKARDLDFRAVLAGKLDMRESRMSMATTSGGHQPGVSIITDDSLKYRTPTQPSIDGNTVEENVEHAEFMRNTLSFQSSFTFINSKFRGLLSAIRGE
jgi:flagellar basal-body rod protein FlgB